MSKHDYVLIVNKHDLNNSHRVLEKLGEKYGWSEHTWYVDDQDNIKAYYRDAYEVEQIISED